MKTIFSTQALLVGIATSNAQEYTHPVKCGDKGGYNLAAVVLMVMEKLWTNILHRFRHGGLISKLSINRYLYSQQGYEIKDAAGTFTQN
jgi:hypothetical protein